MTGRAKAMDRILSGYAANALLVMLLTVEAQARAEGINRAVLPYRPQAVAR